MAPPKPDKGTKKRKPSTHSEAPQSPSKRPRAAAVEAAQPNSQTQSPLLAPHAPVLKDLAAKYDVLPLSIISSTAIAKRLVQAKEHLQPSDAATGDETKQRVVLLYARTAEVCKMITVVEQCKRLLAEQGAPWWQYNQMFDLPAEQVRQKKPKNKRKTVDGVDVTVVEETKLPEEVENAGEDSDSESDAFETMQARFAKAVGPQQSERKTKSLRIFLSTAAVPEVRSREGVTVQSSQVS